MPRVTQTAEEMDVNDVLKAYSTGKDANGVYATEQDRRRTAASPCAFIEKSDSKNKEIYNEQRHRRNLNASINEVQSTQGKVKDEADTPQEELPTSYKLMLDSCQTPALMRIIDLMNSRNDATALKAAVYLLNRKMGTPTDELNKVDGSIDLSKQMGQIVIPADIYQDAQAERLQKPEDVYDFGDGGDDLEIPDD